MKKKSKKSRNNIQDELDRQLLWYLEITDSLYDFLNECTCEVAIAVKEDLEKIIERIDKVKLKDYEFDTCAKYDKELSKSI